MNHLFGENSSDVADSKFEGKLRINSKFVSEGIYKNEEEIGSEFDGLKAVTPNMMTHAGFFHKKKTFFL